MIKVIDGGLKSLSSGKRGDSVKTKRVTDAEGKKVTLYVIDSESPTLGDDITYVFTKNVAKARRAYRQLAGLPERGPAKG